MTALELVRFALYADLGIAFGVPVAAVATRAQTNLSALRPLLTAVVLVGLPLAIFGYLLMVAEMAGTSLRSLDWQLAGELAITTSLGWAFLVRVAALGLASVLYLAAPRRAAWAGAASAAALATLAWSGHAAGGEGATASLQLAGDIVHLFAAAIWLGALVLFLALLRNPATAPKDRKSSLARFATVGSALVAVLIGSGLANLWFITPPGTWSRLVSTGYGELLGGKLALFLVMLALAALNRFVLVPNLDEGSEPGRAQRARLRLGLSIGLEFCAAVSILLVVAKLGLINPGEF